MKKILIFLLPILFIFSCSSDEKKSVQVDTGDTTTVDFYNSEFDFGTIDQGEQVSYSYKFKNTGKKPLLIREVHTSCGCTASSYSKEPVSPGEDGFVDVTFKSAGKRGNQYKVITVVGNTDPEKIELIIKGNVNVPTE